MFLSVINTPTVLAYFLLPLLDGNDVQAMISLCQNVRQKILEALRNGARTQGPLSVFFGHPLLATPGRCTQLKILLTPRRCAWRDTEDYDIDTWALEPLLTSKYLKSLEIKGPVNGLLIWSFTTHDIANMTWCLARASTARRQLQQQLDLIVLSQKSSNRDLQDRLVLQYRDLSNTSTDPERAPLFGRQFYMPFEYRKTAGLTLNLVRVAFFSDIYLSLSGLKSLTMSYCMLNGTNKVSPQDLPPTLQFLKMDNMRWEKGPVDHLSSLRSFQFNTVFQDAPNLPESLVTLCLSGVRMEGPPHVVFLPNLVSLHLKDVSTNSCTLYLPKLDQFHCHQSRSFGTLNMILETHGQPVRMLEELIITGAAFPTFVKPLLDKTKALVFSPSIKGTKDFFSDDDQHVNVKKLSLTHARITARTLWTFPNAEISLRKCFVDVHEPDEPPARLVMIDKCRFSSLTTGKHWRKLCSKK
jgi:hypothetical protein